MGNLILHVEILPKIYYFNINSISLFHSFEEIKSLYSRAFNSISKVLKDDGKAVIGIPDKNLLKLSKDILEIKAIYPVKTHNSLTRYFTVLGL